MKKLVCLLIMCVSLSGCGNEKANTDKEVLINDSKEVNETSETEEITENNNIEGEETEEMLEESFAFSELKNQDFSFLSGAVWSL